MGGTFACVADQDGPARHGRAVPFGISARPLSIYERDLLGTRFSITLATICYATFDDFQSEQAAQLSAPGDAWLRHTAYHGTVAQRA